MNERLKEIAVKAQVEHCVSHVRLQEFAELIVRECSAYCTKQGLAPSTFTAEDLLEHFGIEP